MSQDARAKLHALIDAYYDNVDGAYDNRELNVSITYSGTDGDVTFYGNGADVEVLDEAKPEHWDGDTTGWGGIVKPNAVYINGERVIVKREDFSVDLGADTVATLNAGIILRSLNVRRVFKQEEAK